MKTTGRIDEVLSLESLLAMFILVACPLMGEPREAESHGYVNVFDDQAEKTICTAPHNEDEDYRAAMTIDLDTFDLWEYPAIHDPITGYWYVVAVLGQELDIR